VIARVDEIRKDEPRVGTRKLQDRLAKLGFEIGRDKLFTLLREKGRLVKRKKRGTKTTYSRHGYVVAPNRLKEIEVTAPRQVVVSDITYIRIGVKEFAYLFLVTDLYSRKIVGWHLSRDLSHHAALIALDNAIRQMGDVTGIVHHSDRGCQYCCHEYLKHLSSVLMIPSMTDENHCYQNAVAERVNGILKDELNLDAVFLSFAIAQDTVRRAVEIYNTKRTHWSLKLLTPESVFNKAA
jgi:transposase InsO family protein